MLMQHVKSAPGVQWGTDCKPEKHWCLLHVCGSSNAHFMNATITGLVLDAKMPMLCLSDSSNVALTGALFSGNQAAFITIWDSAALKMVNSTSQHNRLGNTINQGMHLVAGVAAAGSASVSVEGCRFINNTQTSFPPCSAGSCGLRAHVGNSNHLCQQPQLLWLFVSRL